MAVSAHRAVACVAALLVLVLAGQGVLHTPARAAAARTQAATPAHAQIPAAHAQAATSAHAQAATSAHAQIPAAHAQATARAAQGGPLGGVNINGLSSTSTPEDAERSVSQARALHAGVVRIELAWSILRPQSTGGVNAKALAFTDRLMADAAAARIKVVATVDSSPCWASSAPAKLRKVCVVGGNRSAANAWPPSSAAAYASIVGFLAKRYGSKLTAIEVWNEPDQSNQKYFAGPSKPQRYARILRAAYPAVKRGNARTLVLGGSLVGSNGVFLKALYAAGIKGYYDGLAVHFYNLVLGSLRAIHQVQLAAGDTKPLWLNEFGWSSCYPRMRVQEHQACVTAQDQGANLQDVLRSLRGIPYVEAAVVYELRSASVEDFGVLSTTGVRKPAYALLQRALSSPLGSARPVTLRLGSKAGRVVASGSGPVGDYMELDAYQGLVQRYRALFVLDRFNRYKLTLPAALGAHGLRVRVFQFWSGAAAQSSI